MKCDNIPEEDRELERIPQILFPLYLCPILNEGNNSEFHAFVGLHLGMPFEANNFRTNWLFGIAGIKTNVAFPQLQLVISSCRT